MEERGEHLGAATRFKVLDETTCGGEIFRGGGKRLRGKFIVEVVEGQNAEAIAGPEPIEGLKKRLSSLGDGGTGHRAGHINHVKHFYGHARGGPDGWWKSRQEEVGFPGRGFR